MFEYITIFLDRDYLCCLRPFISRLELTGKVEGILIERNDLVKLNEYKGRIKVYT